MKKYSNPKIDVTMLQLGTIMSTSGENTPQSYPDPSQESGPNALAKRVF